MSAHSHSLCPQPSADTSIVTYHVLRSSADTMKSPWRASPPSVVVELAVQFAALDGYTLAATLYCQRQFAAPSSVVLFSCGGAVPAVRYARFARHLAQTGVAVLVYDYRGIGASRPASLREFSASAEDWSEFDCGGAIAYLRQQYPRSQLIGMAHSIGALLTCGAPNIAEISRFVFFCPHTGYYGDYLPRYRLPMALLWHGVMPLATHIFGFFPASMLGLGQDIPAGVALQWSARTSPELHPKATGHTAKRAIAMIARYKQVQGEALAVGFADDAFATPAGSRRLQKRFLDYTLGPYPSRPVKWACRRLGILAFFAEVQKCHFGRWFWKFCTVGPDI